MPELPEVQTVVDRLDPALAGARIAKVRLRRRDIVKHGAATFTRRISGRTVRGVSRHGKRIIWELDSGERLNIHLGMTGTLVLSPAGAEVAAHTHLRISFAGKSEEVRFRDPRRFGGVWLSSAAASGSKGRFSIPLGPDALSLRLPEFRKIARCDRQIKPLLLDQRVIAGLGNIYTDEALFKARIHPRRKASQLRDGEVAALLRSIRAVLRAAIAAGGSSISDYRNADGEEGWFQLKHVVYGREGMPCRRCRGAIERETVGSRSSHFCPRCQPTRRSGPSAPHPVD
jgi:formamidopyrimidine-DNA glycosylase